MKSIAQIVVAVVLSSLTSVVSVVDADETSMREALDRLLEVAKNYKSPSLPEQEPLREATEALDTIRVIPRARWFTVDPTTRVSTVGEPIMELEKLNLLASRYKLLPKDAYLDTIFQPWSEFGLKDADAVVELELSDESFLKFATARLGEPETFGGFEPDVKFEVVPEDNTFAQVILLVTDPNDDSNPLNVKGQLMSFTRYAEISRTNRPGHVGFTDLKLLYATKAGSVRYTDGVNDVYLEFPEAGFVWMHCYGFGFESKTVCRTGEIEDPVYVTLWRYQQ